MERSQRHSVTHEKNMIHIQISSNFDIGAYVFCDLEYPPRVAFNLLKESLEIFEMQVGKDWQQDSKDKDYKLPQIQQQFKLYQDPTNVDKLLKVQQGLDETQAILHNNIEKLLERGENLEKMVEKSKDLNVASKQFYKSSKKMNKGCCQIF